MNFKNEVIDGLMLALDEMGPIRDREQFARSLEQEVTLDDGELDRLNGLLDLCRRYLDAHDADEHRDAYRAILRAHATITYMIAKIQDDEARMASVYEEVGAW